MGQILKVLEAVMQLNEINKCLVQIITEINIRGSAGYTPYLLTIERRNEKKFNFNYYKFN